MKEIKTPAGILYSEDIYTREEDDRIKIFDSEGRYLTYVYYEEVRDYLELIKELSELQTAEDVIDYFGIEYEVIYDEKHMMDLYKYMMKNGYFDVDEVESIKRNIISGDLTDDFILSNEWVNVIGKNYILLRE